MPEPPVTLIVLSFLIACPTAGLDSLAATELRNNLESSLRVQLPGTLVFDYPTVHAIAQHVAAAAAGAASRETDAAIGSASTSDGASVSDDDSVSLSGLGSSEDGNGLDGLSNGEMEAGAGGALLKAQVESKVAAAVAEVVGRPLPATEPLMSGALM